MRFISLTGGVLLAVSAAAFAGTPQAVTLDVQNMTCATCPITVRMALEKVAGVKDVKIDFENKTATVQLDPDKASAQMLTKATTDAGFPSTARK